MDWMQSQDADVVCLQEIKAQQHQLTDFQFHPEGWHVEFFPAERPGYSGTAVYSRQKPDAVIRGLGFPLCDSEGRWLECRFGELSVVSLYLPSGSASDEAQARKDLFLGQLMPLMRQWRQQNRSMIICGDWNMAHKEIDIKNWKGNLKNSGFLPHERAWLSELFDEVGWVDAFRIIDQRPEQYTWWSNRGQAWAKNVGWRIDYHIVSPDWRDQIRGSGIYREQKFSDHAPLTLEYEG